MTTKPTAEKRAGRTRPLGNQERAVMAQSEKGFRAIHEDAIAGMKALHRIKLPNDLSGAARDQIEAATDVAFDALADIAIHAADHREINIYALAGKSKETNDAIAAADASLWRREGNKSKGTGTR